MPGIVAAPLTHPGLQSVVRVAVRVEAQQLVVSGRRRNPSPGRAARVVRMAKIDDSHRDDLQFLALTNAVGFNAAKFYGKLRLLWGGCVARNRCLPVACPRSPFRTSASRSSCQSHRNVSRRFDTFDYGWLRVASGGCLAWRRRGLNL